MSTPTNTKPAFFHWKDVPREQVTPQLSRQLVSGERLMVAQVALEKGCVIPAHEHMHEQITHVVEGHLRLIVGNDDPQTFDLRGGDILHIPSNIPHSGEALENCRVFDFFSPPREDWLNQTDSYLRVQR
jgi:quercetin dioxygenase-like cupin family protein